MHSPFAIPILEAFTPRARCLDGARLASARRAAPASEPECSGDAKTGGLTFEAGASRASRCLSFRRRETDISQECLRRGLLERSISATTPIGRPARRPEGG